MAKKKSASIVISDTHIMSTSGLCPEKIVLDDGSTHIPNKLQSLLNKWFSEFIEDAKRITWGHNRVLILNGDLGELDSKHRSSQIISTNASTVIKTIIETINPLVSFCDKVVVVRGTVAHTGKSSWVEEAIAHHYASKIIPQEEQVYSHYHFKSEIDGIRYDVAHHARMGGMRHTAKGYAQRLALDTMDKYRDRGQEPPHIVLRSHNHRRADSGYNWPTYVSMLPSWQFPTEFIYRIGAENDPVHIGGDIFFNHTDIPPRVIKDVQKYSVHDGFTHIPLDYPKYIEPEAWSELSFT